MSEHTFISKLNTILLAIYFALQILLSDVQVTKLKKEFSLPPFVDIIDLVKK